MSYGGGAEYVASHRRHVTLKKAMDDTLAQHTWAASLPPHPPSRTSRTSSLRPTDRRGRHDSSEIGHCCAAPLLRPSVLVPEGVIHLSSGVRPAGQIQVTNEVAPKKKGRTHGRSHQHRTSCDDNDDDDDDVVRS